MDANGHDDKKTALAPTANATVPATTDHAVTELEKHLGDLAASPQFIPLMGSFRDLLETERRRNRMRTFLIGIGMVALLAVFIWGPLHLIRTYIRQSEARMATERESLQRVEHSLNESMTVLADASRELRRTLESYRQATPAGAGPAAEPPTPAVIPPPVAVRPVLPLVIAPPVPRPAHAVTTTPVVVTAVTTPPPAIAVAPVAPAAVTAKVAVAAVPAATNAAPPAVKQATVTPGVPPDVFRAVTSTPAVPATVAAVPSVPAGTNRPVTPAESRLNDVLDDVERTIMAIKQKSAGTNAIAPRKP